MPARDPGAHHITQQPTRVAAASQAEAATQRTQGGMRSLSQQKWNQMHPSSRPPNKRRRILHDDSATATESSSSGASAVEREGAGSKREDRERSLSTVSSSEHDNELDEDYQQEDEVPSKRTLRRSRHSVSARHRRISSSETIESDDDAASEASSSSSYSSPKPLSPLEINTTRSCRSKSRTQRRSASGAQTGKPQARKQQRRTLPVTTALAPRLPVSPVKFLPSQNTRGFQVRPDDGSASAAFPRPSFKQTFSYPYQQSRQLNEGRSASPQRVNKGAIQAGLRKFAGKMMRKVNNIGSGISANGRTSETQIVPPRRSSSSSNTENRPHDRSDSHSQSTNSNKRKRSSRNTVVAAPTIIHEFGVDNNELAGLQPLRRTRSLARKMEEIGIPTSDDGNALGEDESDDETAQHALTPKASARNRTRQRQETSTHFQEEEDDDAESVERSIAEMSLDEITEHNDDEEDSTIEDTDDAFYLSQATLGQLQRLRKDRLLHLSSLLDCANEKEDVDRSEYTKDVLVKTIIDARQRKQQSSSPPKPKITVRDDSSDSDEVLKSESNYSDDDLDEPPVTVVPSRQHSSTGSPRRTRRSSATALSQSTSTRNQPSQSAPASAGSPRKSRRNNRSSKSYPRQSMDSSAAESGDEGADETRPKPRRRLSQGNPHRSASFTLGMTKSAFVERTPGRLRSGKLRNSLSLSSSDIENHAEEMAGSPEGQDSDDQAELDEEDVPTPIARRTRHRRHLSTASNARSNAGQEDVHQQGEDELPNHEYRLRKVSLPRRAKRNSIIEPSSDEDESNKSEMQASEDGVTSDEDEEAGDTTIEGISDIIEEDEEAEKEEHEEDEDDLEDGFDLGSATMTSLLRLRRGDLVRLCADRDLSTDGTKKELSSQLLDWYQNQQTAASEDSANEADEDDNDEDEDGDEDVPPEGDMSIVSISSTGSEPLTPMPQLSPVRSDRTARVDADGFKIPPRKKISPGGGKRDETKTQALAKLSNKRQSYDKSKQETPLLLGSHPSKHHEVRHSGHVITPPGSGDQQDDTLELDLESLNLLDKEIAPDKLKKGEKIGSGGFKDVYEGKYRNVRVALADIRGHLTENDIKELGLLRDLRHDNIVRFIGVSIPEEKGVPVTIVTELCSNGDLFDYIRNTSPPPFEKILSIMLNVARGLEYLHKRKPATIHRDMKSSNVLITSRGVAKIADFGLARVKNSTRSMIKSLVGTVNWQAPELWVPHPRYNEKIDVYSCAMVFWECLQWHLPTKRYPFEGMNEFAIYQEVGKKKFRPPTATMRRQWGGEILDLVDKMWAQDPSDRPPMSEVVKELEGVIQAEKARARAAR